MINFGFTDTLTAQLTNHITFNTHSVCVSHRLFILRSDSWYTPSALFLMFTAGVDITNTFKKSIRIYWPILTTVYWWLGRCTLICARRGGENGWSLPAKLLLELGIGDVAPDEDGVVQGGLGSADDVEYVAVLLSNRNLSLFLSSLSLFFKSKYSLWEQIK